MLLNGCLILGTIIKHRMARTARASRPRSRRTPVPPLKSAPMHFETDEEEDDTSQSSSSVSAKFDRGV